MTGHLNPLSALCLLAVGTLAACQTTDTLTPAVLERADEAAMATVKQVLATAMDRATVALGPGDLTQTSTVSVLPPGLGPLEGNSTALPVQFDLMVDHSGCYLVRRDTAEMFPADGLECRATSQ